MSCRVLPFWRTASLEMFLLSMAGLTGPSQPPITWLGAASPQSGLIVPTAKLTLTQAMSQHSPTTALGGFLGCSARRSISSCLHPARAGPWEGEEVFCCGLSTENWLWEHGSWRRRLGGAGFPAIVGEIFLLCFSHNCLAVADTVSLPQDYWDSGGCYCLSQLGCWWFLRGSAWSLSPQQCSPQKM